MQDRYDFVIVGGGSAGAVIASRLSEDPACTVALIEAGDRPPEAAAVPVICASLQLNPATDWMYAGDPGKAGLGLNGKRMPVPRGKMLGGSSGINYMAYVRGHPGDFDSWAAGGLTVGVTTRFCPTSARARASRRPTRPRSTRRRTTPTAPLASPFGSGPLKDFGGSELAGFTRGDYNGRDRGGTAVTSLFHDHHAERQAIEHISRVYRGRAREPAEPENHRRRPRHAYHPRRAGREGRGISRHLGRLVMRTRKSSSARARSVRPTC